MSTPDPTFPPTPCPAIAIIGMGPRGISVVERIAAAYAGSRVPRGPLELHVIDDAQIGAGRIWDTGQTRTLCMNTLAGAVTLFTEPGSTVANPIVEGPIQYEWIRLLLGRREGISAAKQELFDAHPPAPEVAEAFAEELKATRPESNPSRALYGAYLRWCYEVAAARLPDSVELIEHHARAVTIDAVEPSSDRAAADVITLSDGTTVTAHATIMATGWQTPGLSASEEGLARAVAAHPQLNWVRPANPVEQDLSGVPESGDVLVRGLGMGFFDVMALLTYDRGGTFHADPTARSGLRYEPSGREPHLVVSSHRGYPYLPKSEYKSLPPTAALPRLRTAIAGLEVDKRGSASIDFAAELWPAIVRDAHEAYYATLAEQDPHALDCAIGELVELIDATDLPDLEDALAAHVTAGEPFRLQRLLRPLDGVSGTPEEVTEAIADSMAVDIAEAVAAWDSPLKAGLWSVSASRKPASIAGAHGRFTEDSRAGLYKEFMALGQMAGSGPPLFRTRELLALIDAGLVTLLGAGTRLRVDEESGEFAMSAVTTGGKEVRSTCLIDAWMHSPDLRRPADPLAASLSAAGRWRPFANLAVDGTPAATGSPETDGATRRLVHPDGSLDARLHVIGIPTYAQMPDTTISPMPGTDSLMLQETDKAATDALRIVSLRS